VKHITQEEKSEAASNSKKNWSTDNGEKADPDEH
jgi:hypothetical protein